MKDFVSYPMIYIFTCQGGHGEINVVFKLEQKGNYLSDTIGMHELQHATDAKQVFDLFQFNLVPFLTERLLNCQGYD